MLNKKLINLLEESKKYIGLTVLINWIALIANIVSIFAIASLLEKGLRGDLTREAILYTAVIVVSVIVIRTICNLLSSKTSYMSSAQVKKVLREKIYQKLLKLGISYNEKIPTSEVVQVAVEGVEQLEIYFGAYLPQLFYSLLAPLTLFAVLSFVNFKSALLMGNKDATKEQMDSALRKLSPAKLEGKDKGNLISIITSDIELLEVFYAHTISPIAIGFITSLIMVYFIGRYHMLLGLIAALGYITVGLIIPIGVSKIGSSVGLEYRNEFGHMNSFMLDSLRGLKEIIQYGIGNKRLEEINERTNKLGEKHAKLKEYEGLAKAITDITILLFSATMLFTSLYLMTSGSIAFDGVLISTISMMGSFGPVVALSSLSNNLRHTLASGNRVLDLLEETPAVEDVRGSKEIGFTGAACRNIDFAYDNEKILDNYSLDISKNSIIGIHGRSGSGKSTLLKLLMRFWDADRGKVLISGNNIKDINTANLRNMESYVTQETYLFNDTIAENISVAKKDATMNEIISAAKKASIHDFIESLPDGYNTRAGELGDSLSTGEKQRIGIARAFLHDAPFILLDEPTSNLDSLNEGIILKSLLDESKNKTMVLVSHRKSTMNIADVVYNMESKRVS